MCTLNIFFAKLTDTFEKTPVEFWEFSLDAGKLSPSNLLCFFFFLESRYFLSQILAFILINSSISFFFFFFILCCRLFHCFNSTSDLFSIFWNAFNFNFHSVLLLIFFILPLSEIYKTYFFQFHNFSIFIINFFFINLYFYACFSRFSLFGMSFFE